MRLIQQNGASSSCNTTERLQLPNGAGYCVLNALIEKGYIKVHNFKNNPNKTGYFYLPTSAGIQEKSRLMVGFIERKKKEYDRFKAEIDALQREHIFPNHSII
jgi:hypothetical protein